MPVGAASTDNETQLIGTATAMPKTRGRHFFPLYWPNYFPRACRLKAGALVVKTMPLTAKILEIDEKCTILERNARYWNSYVAITKAVSLLPKQKSVALEPPLGSACQQPRSWFSCMFPNSAPVSKSLRIVGQLFAWRATRVLPGAASCVDASLSSRFRIFAAGLSSST
jgi:hypothetical protein